MWFLQEALAETESQAGLKVIAILLPQARQSAGITDVSLHMLLKGGILPPPSLPSSLPPPSLPLTSLTLLSWVKRFHEPHPGLKHGSVAEDNPDLLLLLCLHPSFWDYRRLPPHPSGAGLKMEGTQSVMHSKQALYQRRHTLSSRGRLF